MIDLEQMTEDRRWYSTEVGQGRVTPSGDRLHLHLPTAAGGYHNAQISDYPYPPRQFLNAPGVRLSLRAWASADAAGLIGTAGFGFWNHPFSPDSWRVALPRALWFFFAAPPSDMALAEGVPGWGWKAAQIDATRPSAYAMLPIAPALVAAMQVPALRRRGWRGIQRRLGIAERALDPALLGAPHTYAIDWGRDRARLTIDDALVMETEAPPRGRMGIILWIDNQYAVATPRGRLGFGVTPLTAPQSLTISDLRVKVG